jgi:hypothetical protein
MRQDCAAAMAARVCSTMPFERLIQQGLRALREVRGVVHRDGLAAVEMPMRGNAAGALVRQFAHQIQVHGALIPMHIVLQPVQACSAASTARSPARPAVARR